MKTRHGCVPTEAPWDGNGLCRIHFVKIRNIVEDIAQPYIYPVKARYWAMFENPVAFVTVRTSRKDTGISNIHLFSLSKQFVYIPWKHGGRLTSPELETGYMYPVKIRSRLHGRKMKLLCSNSYVSRENTRLVVSC